MKKRKKKPSFSILLSGKFWFFHALQNGGNCFQLLVSKFPAEKLIFLIGTDIFLPKKFNLNLKRIFFSRNSFNTKNWTRPSHYYLVFVCGSSHYIPRTCICSKREGSSLKNSESKDRQKDRWCLGERGEWTEIT